MRAGRSFNRFVRKAGLALALCLVVPVGSAQGLRVTDAVTDNTPTMATVVDTGQQGTTEEVVRVEPVIRDGRLYIDADVDFELSPELQDVVYKGIPLYFTVDVEIRSTRWWWFDKTIVDANQTWRVTYNALTRQWRVGSGELLLPESSLNEALASLRHIRGWAVAPVSDFDKNTELYGRLRLRLDTSLLTRPFQVDAMNRRAWTLSTPWKNFTFSISDAEHQP